MLLMEGSVCCCHGNRRESCLPRVDLPTSFPRHPAAFHYHIARSTKGSAPSKHMWAMGCRPALGRPRLLLSSYTGLGPLLHNPPMGFRAWMLYRPETSKVILEPGLNVWAVSPTISSPSTYTSFGCLDIGFGSEPEFWFGSISAQLH